MLLVRQDDVDLCVAFIEFLGSVSPELGSLGLSSLDVVNCDVDEKVVVKTRQALEKYDEIKFFKENREKFAVAERKIGEGNKLRSALKMFLGLDKYKNQSQKTGLQERIRPIAEEEEKYVINVSYISSAGNYLEGKYIVVQESNIRMIKNDPSLIMGKGEYNKFLRERQKEALLRKRQDCFSAVNKIIDYANKNKDNLVLSRSCEELDKLIANLFDRVVSKIEKIKVVDGEEWEVIDNSVSYIYDQLEKIVNKNQKILDYYNSESFFKVKETCKYLMDSQQEFNEYISEKAHSISKLFGVRVVRNQTKNEDRYNYIRPYRKTITPFTAEVSKTVFSSAENNPLEYIVKHFYPNRSSYPEQIQKLHHLVEELETLRDAKRIIDNYRSDYQQYLGEVPSYVIKEDEAGFYSRLGFANLDESVLTVEYTFTYTSDGGMAQRSFSVPMTEELIIALIETLQSKLSAKSFAEEQRRLMTRKLREFIKERDDFTCSYCGNSTHKEPNLLLEIDHILPVAKGGYTVEDNLQTLCWKCNRSKSDKILTK